MTHPGPEFERIGAWRDDLGIYRGALTLPVDPAGRVLLQMRDDIPDIIKPGQWCFFGGGIEAGEDPQTAAQREFEEETGLAYDNSEFVPSYAVLNGSPNWGLLYVFVLKLTHPLSDIELNEGSGFALCTRKQAEKLDLIWYIRDVLNTHWAK